MADPTPAELVLQIRHLAEQMTRLVASVERLQSTMETSYVRRDVYDSNHGSLRREVETKYENSQSKIKALEVEMDSQDKFRRQVWSSVGMLALGIIASMFVALLTGGGGPV